MYLQFHGELHYNKNVDQTLREYFPNYDYKGVFFDVGAFEPITISNSYHFEQNEWDCHCFEANTNGIPLLKKYRKNVYNYAISNEDKDAITFNIVTFIRGETVRDEIGETDPSWTASYSAIEISEEIKQHSGCNIQLPTTQITVPQKTLNTIIKTEIPNLNRIDIMSIDIEGGELNCLYGFDLNKYKPRVIVIENITDNNKIKEYLTKFGYILDKKISYNHYYISNDFYAPNTFIRPIK